MAKEMTAASDSGKQTQLKRGTQPSRRGPGRPQTGGGSNVSRDTILRTGLDLAMTTPLQDLSIVTVAKAMNVTPPLIHYYVGGRDWLTSGVMNLFYKDLLDAWPAETGDWRDDLLAVARTLFEHFTRYGGIAAYCVSNSRFRIYQLTAFGDREYGIEMLNRFTGSVRASGLSGERTGIFANQFLEFIIATSHATAQHMYPREHFSFLETKLLNLDKDLYPHITYAGYSPMTIDGEVAFAEGCNLYLLGIATEVGGLPLSEAVSEQLGDTSQKEGEEAGHSVAE